MTQFFPTRPNPGTDRSELDVWQALSSLPDDWRVFHHVPWQSARRGRQGDGEADFILLHPKCGLVVLEVKGGGLELRDGRWFQTNLATGESKQLKLSPFEQAMLSKHMLLEKLAELGLSGLPVCHAVVFTRTTVAGDVALDGPREIVIDAADLSDPDRALGRVLTHWGVAASLPEAVVGRVTKLLAPTRTFTRTLRSHVESAKREQLTLTETQYIIASGLRRNRRALILGSAGTGKTLLALAESDRLSSSGFSVLLTCFNAPLAEYLAAQAATDVDVRTFHSLCQRELSRSGVEMPIDPGQDWWDRDAAVALAEVAGASSTRYDAIVIDEFQDFSAEWLDALFFFLSRPEDGPVYVFADSHQDLYRRSCVLPSWPTYELDINCRNTLQIADKVAALFGDDVKSHAADGPSPRFVSVTSEENAIELVPTVVQDLIDDEDLLVEQIVVLSDSRRIVDELRDRSGPSFVFVERGQEGVVVETIHRMKGLEADVVLLVTSATLDLSSGDGKALLYVGMSRPRGMLFVLGTKTLQRELGWGVA